jgi:hypothetical protein
VKHSAKAVAKLAREREKQARASLAARSDGADSAAAPNSPEARPRTAATAPAPAPGAWPAAARSATPITAQSRSRARRLAQLPYAIVMAGILVGLGVMRGGAQDVKGGTLVMAGALLAGSLARLVLPEGRIGLLGSRRRLLDAAALTALGVGLLIAGLIVKVPG